MQLQDRFNFLCEVKDVLDKARILFWVDFGTLLGFVREKDFIEFDPDIDISTKREDQDKVIAIVEELKKLGKVVSRVETGEAGKHYLAGYEIWRDDLKIDLYFWCKCKNKRLWAVSQWDKVLVFPEEYFDNLEEIEIKGVKFKTPNNIEKYLELHYGKEWRTPDPTQDLHKTTTVIENNKNYLKYLI
jgi:phosphorylcholine metabolism protein LicD